MRYVRVSNPTRGFTLGTRIGVAEGWWQRVRGLVGRGPLLEGEGLLLRPCRAVHMFGMRYPLDVAFVDRRGEVVARYAALPPGGRTGWHREALDALELPAGTLEATGTQEGDTVVYTEEVAS